MRNVPGQRPERISQLTYEDCDIFMSEIEWRWTAAFLCTTQADENRRAALRCTHGHLCVVYLPKAAAPWEERLPPSPPPDVGTSPQRGEAR